jgi:hypothetical protein
MKGAFMKKAGFILAIIAIISILFTWIIPFIGPLVTMIVATIALVFGIVAIIEAHKQKDNITYEVITITLSGISIALAVVLLICQAIFGASFSGNYDRIMEDIDFANSSLEEPYAYLPQNDVVANSAKENAMVPGTEYEIEQGVFFTLDKLTLNEGQTNNTVTIEYTLDNTTGKEVGIATPNLVMFVDDQVLELTDPIEGHLRVIPTGTSTHTKNYTVAKDVSQIGYVSSIGEKFTIELTE